ncbi:AAA family ATPase [Mannheimia pernigra]|uniref:AAA family ATPase n=1 Tax=Mannheimia pernigra TaxID=111844 RepID=UPI00159F531B|nr:AAA family ATPase [Mannheimia pernigra]QLB43570.1 AAA family ATPase [Mannheimia pernigra]
MNLIEQVKGFLTENSVSQAKLAKESGVNAGALSAYLNGNYSGDIANVEAKLTAYLNKKEVQAREFVEAPAFIQTATARQIFKTLEFAQIANCMATVYGMSGVGKTKAIQEFKKGRANVWLVTASPSRSSLSEILYEIALELGISDAPRRKGTLSRLIARKIKGTEGLLIVDEADHLPYEALEELRIMQEEANIGLVLVGNDKVYTRMKGGISPHHEYARLWSRVAKNTSIQKTKQADTKAVAKAWGLSEDEEALKVMQSITETGGGLRILTQTLRLAGMVAKGLDRVITAELIMQARQELLGKGD